MVHGLSVENKQKCHYHLVASRSTGIDYCYCAIVIKFYFIYLFLNYNQNIRTLEPSSTFLNIAQYLFLCYNATVAYSANLDRIFFFFVIEKFEVKGVHKSNRTESINGIFFQVLYI